MDDYIEHMTKGKQPAYWTVLLVIAGTYLLFIALSVLVLRFLRAKKKFYYRKRQMTMPLLVNYHLMILCLVEILLTLKLPKS